MSIAYSPKQALYFSRGPRTHTQTAAYSVKTSERIRTHVSPQKFICRFNRFEYTEITQNLSGGPQWNFLAYRKTYPKD